MLLLVIFQRRRAFPYCLRPAAREQKSHASPGSLLHRLVPHLGLGFDVLVPLHTKRSSTTVCLKLYYALQNIYVLFLACGIDLPWAFSIGIPSWGAQEIGGSPGNPMKGNPRAHGMRLSILICFLYAFWYSPGDEGVSVLLCVTSQFIEVLSVR